MEPMYRPTYPDEPDWEADEALLYARSREAIAGFTAEHPREACSFFAFDSEPSEGYVLIALDTRENEIAESNRDQAYEIENRVRQFARENAWEVAPYYVAESQSYAHSTNTGGFADPDYAAVEFPGWNRFAASFTRDLPPQGTPGFAEAESQALDLYSSYLKGHVMLIFWRVIERLIASGDLDGLNLASPFRLGFNFHDQGLITVVRIINWPAAA
jgi:hypothetical protein